MRSYLRAPPSTATFRCIRFRERAFFHSRYPLAAGSVPLHHMQRNSVPLYHIPRTGVISFPSSSRGRQRSVEKLGSVYIVCARPTSHFAPPKRRLRIAHLRSIACRQATVSPPRRDSTSEILTETILDTPFSSMVTPNSTSAFSMVGLRWVMTMNWVFSANRFK